MRRVPGVRDVDRGHVVGLASLTIVLTLCAVTGSSAAGALVAAGSTRGSGIDLRPTINAVAFTGHGELAFVSRSELYLLEGTRTGTGTGDRTGGTLRQVTRGLPAPSDPSFSHDGRWLAFLRFESRSSGEGTLWIARGDGIGAHPVSGLPPVEVVPNSGAPVFSWSPTSDQLVVTTGPVNGASLVPQAAWVVPAAGRPRRLIGPNFVNGVTWSPDGREVAVVVGDPGLGRQALVTLAPTGDARTTWFEATGGTYYLAGWSSRLGLLLWSDQGNGGPSVENYGLPLTAISRPGSQPTTLTTAPLFQPPALAIGPTGELAVVANGDPQGGEGEGEKFVWFGKQVELCSAIPGGCAAVLDQPGSVTLNPAFSPVDGSLAFVEAPQSSQGLPPMYSATQTWPVVAGWYEAHSLWVLSEGSGTPVEVDQAAGAADPLWSSGGAGLVFVRDQAIWLLASPSSAPVEVASPLASPTSSSSGGYLFGYVDWPAQFAWWDGTP